VRIQYVHETVPLGTGGAVRNAENLVEGRAVVMNGDVLSNIDVRAALDLHDRTGAAATIVLHPVENPSAYGLVETEPDGKIRRFLEKPKPEEITTNRINAGLYVLERRTFDLIPKGVPHSIERGYFPALIASGERVQAHIHEGYWIDIGTPEKYLQVHEDLLSGRFSHSPAAARRGEGLIHETARVSEGAVLDGRFYIGPGCEIDAHSRIEDGATLIRDVRVSGGSIARSVLWPGVTVEDGARVDGALVGQGVRVGPHATVRPGAVLGAGTVVSAYTRA
jgi:NDP-sugar pyrophosphorylase family protein